MSLLDNIIAQMEQIRIMNRQPKALRCDPDSFDCLIDELAPFITSSDCDPKKEMRIYGLRVEICSEPNFEVV